MEEPAPWAFGVIQPDCGVPFVRGGSWTKGSSGHAADRWDNAWGAWGHKHKVKQETK